MIPALPACCLALLAPLAAAEEDPSATAAGTLVWEDVAIPASFALDLGTGRVSDRREDGRASLSYQGGVLSAPVPLRALSPGPVAPRELVRRGEGEAVEGLVAEVGRELVFDLGGEGWGYLRVLEANPHRVLLECVRRSGGSDLPLRREPARLEARSLPGGVALEWTAEEGERYRVERRFCPRQPFDGRPPWVELASPEGPRWFDGTVEAQRLAEYRVSRIRPGGGLGARARGVGGLLPEEELAVVPAGSGVNLFSGALDAGRVDLTVEYVRSSGVQVHAGEGVRVRLLSDGAGGRWDTPGDLDDAPPGQRAFLSPGRVLALLLPEGLPVRLRVVEVRGHEALLRRQINLDGSRVFPPAPRLPEVHWEAGCGVLFAFQPSPGAAPGDSPPALVIEREGTLDAEDWSVCRTGAPGQLQLVDPEPGAELLVRYRFRQRPGDRRLSPPSAPITVLVGDDGGEGGDVLLDRAFGELGHEDYGRRTRARAVILAMGERAWPRLRDALRSADPQVAHAARELILSFPEPEGAERTPAGRSGLAQLLLGVHAGELGAGPPPAPEWIAEPPGARASAALRGVGAREGSAVAIEAWRRVLEEADPDLAVRMVASVAAQLEREGLGGDAPLAARISAAGDPLPAGDWGLSGLEGALEAGPDRPWRELALSQVHHDLAAGLEGSEEARAAGERALLVQLQLAAFDRTGDSLFLDGALRTVQRPSARLRGALDLARSCRLWDRFEDGGRPRATVRLPSADAELLEEALASLESSDVPGAEIVLPEGVYEPLRPDASLVVDGARFRLRGEGVVELRCGIALRNGCDVLLQNLTIAPASGFAIHLTRSRVRLVDCVLRGPRTGLFGTEAVVELDRTAVLPPPGEGHGAQGIRLTGRSLLLARGSRIESHGTAIGGARATLLDRCAVISRGQTGIEGDGDGDLWVVASLLRGGNAALARVERGLLDGVVLLSGERQGLRISPRVRICAEHLRSDGELAELDASVWLDRCALGD